MSRPLIFLLVVLAGVLAGVGVMITMDPARADHSIAAPTANLLAVDATTAPTTSSIPAPIINEPGAAANLSATSTPTTTATTTTTTPAVPFAAESQHCPDQGRAAVVDRDAQRTWLCEDGEVQRFFPVTTQRSQPDPGDYTVDAKDLNASSTIGGQYTTMTHFVVFTRGKYQGARIGFHSVPKDSAGAWIQPLDSVGTLEYHGVSSGCLRVLPEDAEAIWNFLDNGGLVRVIT